MGMPKILDIGTPPKRRKFSWVILMIIGAINLLGNKIGITPQTKIGETITLAHISGIILILIAIWVRDKYNGF